MCGSKAESGDHQGGETQNRDEPNEVYCIEVLHSVSYDSNRVSSTQVLLMFAHL